ncbi:cysteine desulfurase family protein [Candidatus Vidania fulgoroideorum]
MNNKIIYFDNASSTKIDKAVFKKMFNFLENNFGNGGSLDHKVGVNISNIIEKKRFSISKILKCEPEEVIFTSSATEANNLAIKGMAFYDSLKKTFLTLKTEHKSVINVYKRIEEFGHKVIYLDVDNKGICSYKEIKKNIIENKVNMISIMMVNNEIGVIQNIKKIGKLCKKMKIVFHVDCTQAFGKIPINIRKNNINLLSISAHKIYGPQGIGLLYKNKKINLYSEIQGGDQEMGLRSGTLPSHQIVGLCEAMKLAHRDLIINNKKISKISNFIKEKIFKIKNVILNGSENKRIPHNLNFSFEAVEGESLMMKMKNFALSSGSACNSLNLEPSYVLNCIKTPKHLIHNSIRITIGKYNNIKEAKLLTNNIKKSINYLRKISPLWDMKKRKINIEKFFNEI